MATAKYDPGRRWRHRNTHGYPRLSDHVVGGVEEGRGRWDERMPDDCRSPEWVLVRADPVPHAPHLRQWAGSNLDRVWLADCVTRTGERYRPLFLEQNDLIVTCYRVGQVKDRPSRTYLAAVAEERTTLQEAEL